jgi:hypothetical protein
MYYSLIHAQVMMSIGFNLKCTWILMCSLIASCVSMIYDDRTTEVVAFTFNFTMNATPERPEAPANLLLRASIALLRPSTPRHTRCICIADQCLCAIIRNFKHLTINRLTSACIMIAACSLDLHVIGCSSVCRHDSMSSSYTRWYTFSM